MTTAASSLQSLAEVIESELRDRGTSVRATKERAYLKSDLVHYGVGVPGTRAVVATTLRGVELDHDGIVALVEALWNSTGALDDASRGTPVYECCSAATMVLIQTKDHLGAGDTDLFERLLRQSRTWALVDPLAGDAVGPLSEHDAKFAPVLERWASDDDFWIRRSALLAHLRPLREGRGDFERFSRLADAMLEETEFFIRKAIGWVLRDTARTRPEMVFDWMLPRAHRASGVTMREVVKHLSPEQRNALLAAKGTRRSRAGSG
ncbi:MULTISPECIES: DNA alkylation repair protein [Brevibacterium]|uniref:DNA alkylation repair enzyme n=2 Tax=Brevibacterium antiquum TaxID=234835 RepID=A0A2H1KPN2_9MICO|nr:MULTISPECIES: DNA alkylation repair protein [Brevibacterium]SMY01696.1 DNA alkylation repair enzyme [Brevibacterium antiquum CNRZ 918]SMY02504.1 DNA alkylation repair enzyme [Brevibacterium antiquum]HCG56090.1 DNA alkylation repair protein [Brevibacterium sp.]